MWKLFRCQRFNPALFVLPLLAVTSVFLLAAPQVITRTWKSSDGLYSIDAEYVGTKDGKVSLRKQNGAVIEVALDRLSTEDKAYVDTNEIFNRAEKNVGAFAPVPPTQSEPPQEEVSPVSAEDNGVSRKMDDRFRKYLEEAYAAIDAGVALEPTTSYQEAMAIPEYNDPREKAIMDTRVIGSGKVMDLVSKMEKEREIEQRRQLRAYAEKASPEIVKIAKELQMSVGDRRKRLEIIRKLKPEQRDEVLRVAAGVSQQMGDDRGSIVARSIAAIYSGLTYRFGSPLIELFRRGGTAKDIGFIGQLDAMAMQEFHSYRPSDPWYERYPLQAIEMLPLAFLIGGLIFVGYLWKVRSATQLSTAPMQPKTNSVSNSSDAELESLKKKNEELKRKIEAKKLAEKRANDRTELEAENARLIKELGGGIVSSKQSSDVHSSSVADKYLADRTISGVGGWLALLVAVMLVWGPLWSILKTSYNIWVAEMQTPELKTLTPWQTFKIVTWCVVGAGVVYSMISGLLLCVKKEPVSVTNAIACLWIGGPVAAFVLGVLIPGFSFGTEALEEILPESIKTIIGSSIAATIWTAYLRKSKRVKNTYFP